MSEDVEAQNKLLVGIEKISDRFSDWTARSHFEKITSKAKRKFNAVKFKSLIHRSHMHGTMEVLQYLTVICRDIRNDEKLSEGEKLDLIEGEVELALIKCGREFKRRYRTSGSYPSNIDIEELRERSKHWNLRFDYGEEKEEVESS